MKLDVKVKNLGKIKEAEFHIRPMTVITGPNGTGKSFFTKSLYSILNVINRNVYHESVKKTIREIQVQLKKTFSFPDKLKNEFEETFVLEIISELDSLLNEFQEASSWEIDEYFTFATFKVGNVEELKTVCTMYLEKLVADLEKNNLQDLTISPESDVSQAIGRQTLQVTLLAQQKKLLEKIKNSRGSDFSLNLLKKNIIKDFDQFLSLLKEPNNYYSQLFKDHIENELKDNFQIPTLSDLISFNEEIIKIEIDKLLVVEISDNKKNIILNAHFINAVACLSSVVFFESPAYWKVREALKSAKNNQNIFLVKSDDVLTGVPKYFYDLDDVLNVKTKTEGTFKSATDILGNTLGGEFVFKSDSLSFSDRNGREISKHLVSFGMTNLGMIQALLKYNIITQGSFIFIDEPETNLHPDWQVKLVEVLLILAKGGVNVVITTHSSDLMKALEVKIKKQQIDIMEDFLSVHFVDVDGKLLEFESEEPIQQLIEARSLLNAAYEELYFSDL